MLNRHHDGVEKDTDDHRPVENLTFNHVTYVNTNQLFLLLEFSQSARTVKTGENNTRKLLINVTVHSRNLASPISASTQVRPTN